jgi:hypothetical protein
VGISTHLYAFLKGCKVPKILVPVGREYADWGEFQDSAPPPAFEYMGKKIWTDKEWHASAPFLITMSCGASMAGQSSWMRSTGGH